MSSNLFQLVSEKQLEGTDIVIAEKITPMAKAISTLGTIGTLAGAGTYMLNTKGLTDNLTDNKFQVYSNKIGKIVSANVDYKKYAIIYTDENGNKLVRQGGDINKLAYNPGNIALPRKGFGPRNQQIFKDMGAIGWFRGSKNMYAIFPDEATGRKALYQWLFHTGRKDWTVRKMIHIYAPEVENNTDNYLKFINSHGLKSELKLGELSSKQQDSLVNAIIKMEGKKEPKEQFISKKDLLAKNVKADKVSVYESNEFNSKSEPIELDIKSLHIFYKWFGNSKVLDSEGRPLVVYHGTNAVFQSFSKKYYGNYQELGAGFYFTDDESDAEGYGVNVTPFYLRIENPFTATKNQLQIFKNYTKLDFEVDDIKEIEDIIELVNRLGKKKFSKTLIELGFDGVILYGQYVVYSSNQMKAAEYGNIGTYKRSSNNFNESKNINTKKAPLYVASSIDDICLTMKQHKLNSVKVSYDSSIDTYIFGDTYNFVHWSLISCAFRNGLYKNFEFEDDDELCHKAIDYCCDLDNFAIATTNCANDLISDHLEPEERINEYGQDFWIYRNHEVEKLNEGVIPTYEEDGTRYFYGYYCFTESELLNMLDSKFSRNDVRVAYEFNKHVYMFSDTITTIHYNIVFLAATETNLFDSIPEIKENKNADEDTVQELIKQYLYIAPFKIYRNDSQDSDEMFLRFLFNTVDNTSDYYDMACKINETKWAVCRSDEFGDVKQVPLLQGKEWITADEYFTKYQNDDEEELNESVENNKVIAYRGLDLTNKEFEKQFSFEEGKPQFFSKDINVAASFGNFIYKCELQLNKPLDITNEKSCYVFLGKLFNNYKKELQIALKQETNEQIKDKISYIIECIDNQKLWKTYLQDLIYVNWDKIIETAKQQGFDSIISKEESNDTYSSDKGYIIWSNKNIKKILNKYYYDWEDTYNFLTFDEYKNKYLTESQEEFKKIIAYHGSQTDKLQFMKNHALYLTDNYDLAYEFATKDGDGGLVSGEVATLYTCELNLKKVYETHSEAEYDANFVDISFNREKWLEKGFNAIIIHPTEASKTTYYIMLNPEEDVKIIDKEIIDYGDLLLEGWIPLEMIICFQSDTLTEGIHGNVCEKNAKYFIKKAEENGFKFAGWNQSHKADTTNSFYFKVIGNTIYQCRSSDHDNNKAKANDIDTYITSSTFNPELVDKVVNNLVIINNNIQRIIDYVTIRMKEAFIKDYILNSVTNQNDYYLMYNLIKKHSLIPSNSRFDIQKYVWFKKKLKQKVEQFLEAYPEYKKYKYDIGILSWNEQDNYLERW